MKVVGFHQFVPANQTSLIEWECPEDVEGIFADFDIANSHANNFGIMNFSHERDGQIDDIIGAKEDVEQSKKFGFPVYDAFVPAPVFSKLLKSHCPYWHVSKGSKISIRVYNVTGSAQTFPAGFVIRGDLVSNDVRWWADEHGKLVRPLNQLERGLRLGDQVGSLRVVNPHTYEGFDAQR